MTRELRRDGSRPFITWYGEAGGERVELSVATTANWVAKTAGYLADDLGTEPGETVGGRLPLHWLSAVWLLGAWSVGAEVDYTGDVDVPLDPMGAGFSRLVAAYPDAFAPSEPSGAEAVAAAPQVPAGARVLTTLPLDATGVGWGLLGPLAAGGSAVYAIGGSLDQIATAERVTHTAGVELAGLPRLD